MKVVINSCFGGFGLSMIAQQEYLERKGKKAYFYKQTIFRFMKGEVEYVRLKNINEKERGVTYTYTKNIGEIINELPNENHWYYGKIKRDDKDLVAVVEKLGDKASDSHAKLNVVEIPDGVEWEINNYDGMEHIAEKHQTWR